MNITTRTGIIIQENGKQYLKLEVDLSSPPQCTVVLAKAMSAVSRVEHEVSSMTNDEINEFMAEQSKDRISYEKTR